MTALNKITYKQLYNGLAGGKKILFLTGEAGSGKTTLVRRAVSELVDSCVLIELQTGALKLDELIDYICRKLHLSIDAKGSISQRVTDLKKALEYQRIKHTVVLIEQVREIYSELVNAMLLLSQYQSDRSSCIQFVITGPRNRNNRFQQLVLKTFGRDDLSSSCISPLDHSEVVSYIAHYLDQAGCNNRILFTPEALEQIAKYSGGIPRLINLLCNGGLLAAFLEEKECVDAAMIDEATTHCLYLGTGDIQPVMNENKVELPAKHDSPTEKVSIVPGWPFKNTQEGVEIEVPDYNDKQLSGTTIVDVENANSNSQVKNIWDCLSFNVSQNQSLPATSPIKRRNDGQTQQSANQGLDPDNTDEFTPSIANSGIGRSLSEMIKKASKSDLSGLNGPSLPYEPAERIHNTVDLGTNEITKSVINETAEKLHGLTANSTIASASQAHELDTQPNTNQQSSALKDQDSAANPTFSDPISLPEIIGKAAEHSLTLQRRLGLSTKYSKLTNGFNFDGQTDSWMGLEITKMNQVTKLGELIGTNTLTSSVNTWSNITGDLSDKSNSGISSDPMVAESLSEESPPLSPQRPDTDTSNQPHMRIETQACTDTPKAESTSSVYKSFGLTGVVLGILMLGLFVFFGSEKRFGIPIPGPSIEVGSGLGDVSVVPVVKPLTKLDDKKNNNEAKLYSGLVSAEPKKASDRRKANKPKEPIDKQQDLAKNQKHMLEAEFDKWLRLAEQQLSKKQLTTPENDNALTSYRTILKMGPTHEKALSGIRKIKETYMLWARSEIRRGNVRNARLLYQKALDVAPDDAEVLAALETLKFSQRNADKGIAYKPDSVPSKFVPRAERINALLDRANRQMYLNQLIDPVGDNALSTYRKVLRLVPRNPEALNGIAEIKSTYLNWAKSAMDNHDWDRAKVFYERALQVDPTDRTVISMIRDLKLRKYPIK